MKIVTKMSDGEECNGEIVNNGDVWENLMITGEQFVCKQQTNDI